MENKTKKSRISSKVKTEIVLDLLRGVSIEELSRQNKIAIHQLTLWREQFIEKGSQAFKKVTKDTKVSELERIIGKQHIEIELLKKKTGRFGKANGNL